MTHSWMPSRRAPSDVIETLQKRERIPPICHELWVTSRLSHRSEIRLLSKSQRCSVFALFSAQKDVRENNKWTDVCLIFWSDSETWRLLPFLSQLGVYMWLVKHMVCSSEFFGAVQTSEETYLSGIPLNSPFAFPPLPLWVTPVLSDCKPLPPQTKSKEYFTPTLTNWASSALTDSLSVWCTFCR